MGTIRLEESVQRASANKGKEDRKDNDRGTMMASNRADNTPLPRPNTPSSLRESKSCSESNVPHWTLSFPDSHAAGGSMWQNSSQRVKAVHFWDSFAFSILSLHLLFASSCLESRHHTSSSVTILRQCHKGWWKKIPRSVDPLWYYGDDSPEYTIPGFLFSSSLFIGFSLICSQMHTWYINI